MNETKPNVVLVHAPYGRDAPLICQMLGHSGISGSICLTVENLCSALDEGTGAALISDQALNQPNVACLAAVLSAQPPWSDIPLIVTTSGGEATHASRSRLKILEPLGNLVLLERPLRAATLVSAVKTAIRARDRQHQLREHFQERERLVKELERSNEELGQFAHVVSHDLQAPVRMVKSFTELLARRYRGQLDTTADEFIATIEEGASTMEALIRTLLNYATLGQEPLALKPVGFRSVVDAVVTTLQPIIDELHAKVASEGELPIVHGDRVLLQQLVQNLVVNALKYRGSTVRPIISVSVQPQKDGWKFAVSDNGPGIERVYHESIFQPLKRLHGKEISGTGMGLTVCRKIVERHGGKMWVESKPGNGATFYFTLPTSGAKENAPTADAASGARR